MQQAFPTQLQSTEALAVRTRMATRSFVFVLEWSASGDGFLGQLFTMLLPHAGPEAFIGGPGGAAMLPHHRGCRC